MREVVISVDILCAWTVTPPVYRLYIDEDLLTERTYIWSNPDQYVKEHIIANLEPGIHTLKLVSATPGFKNFQYQNFTVDKTHQTLVNDQFILH